MVDYCPIKLDLSTVDYISSLKSILSRDRSTQQIISYTRGLLDHHLSRHTINATSRKFILLLNDGLLALGLITGSFEGPSCIERRDICIKALEGYYYYRFHGQGQKSELNDSVESSHITENLEKNLRLKPDEIVKSDGSKNSSQTEITESSTRSPVKMTTAFSKEVYQQMIEEDTLGVDAMKKELKKLNVNFEASAKKEDLKQLLTEHVNNMPDKSDTPTPTPPAIDPTLLATIISQTVTATTQALQSVQSKDKDKKSGLATFQDVFDELNEHLPQSLSCGRFGKLAAFLPTAASKNGKKSRINEIKSFELMFCAIARQIQSLAASDSCDNNDLTILTSMLELVAFCKLNNKDKIDVVRMAWYDTLQNISDIDFEYKTPAQIRATVRQSFNNSLEDTRAVEKATESSRPRSSSSPPHPSGSGSARSKKFQSNRPCSYFNSEAGCKMTEDSCSRRHICSYHYTELKQTFSDHSSVSCRAKKSRSDRQAE